MTTRLAEELYSDRPRKKSVTGELAETFAAMAVARMNARLDGQDSVQEEASLLGQDLGLGGIMGQDLFNQSFLDTSGANPFQQQNNPQIYTTQPQQINDLYQQQQQVQTSLPQSMTNASLTTTTTATSDVQTAAPAPSLTTTTSPTTTSTAAPSSQPGDAQNSDSSSNPSPFDGANSSDGQDSNGLTQKKRARATPEQLAILEETFAVNPSPTGPLRKELAAKCNMTERSVQIWFQNRRARVRLMQRRHEQQNLLLQRQAAYLLAQQQYQARMMGGYDVAGMGNPMMASGVPAVDFTWGQNKMLQQAQTSPMMTPGTMSPAITPSMSPAPPAEADPLDALALPFSCNSLRIGTWRRVPNPSEAVEDLLCTVNVATRTFRWQIEDGGSGFRIEFPFSAVTSAKLEPLDGLSSQLILDLAECPVFFMEVATPNPDGITATRSWTACRDFTEGMQASTVLRHILRGPKINLEAELLSVMQADAGFCRVASIVSNLSAAPGGSSSSSMLRAATANAMGGGASAASFLNQGRRFSCPDLGLFSPNAGATDTFGSLDSPATQPATPPASSSDVHHVTDDVLNRPYKRAGSMPSLFEPLQMNDAGVEASQLLDLLGGDATTTSHSVDASLNHAQQTAMENSLSLTNPTSLVANPASTTLTADPSSATTADAHHATQLTTTAGHTDSLAAAIDPLANLSQLPQLSSPNHTHASLPGSPGMHQMPHHQKRMNSLPIIGAHNRNAWQLDLTTPPPTPPQQPLNFSFGPTSAPGLATGLLAQGIFS
ncbi:hypothetical protein HK102_006524 [Quaeritorhiza haematococci]|nr:hypothetical protein HK102_006524 [Quaeritorhiza haematococci]